MNQVANYNKDMTIINQLKNKKQIRVYDLKRNFTYDDIIKALEVVAESAEQVKELNSNKVFRENLINVLVALFVSAPKAIDRKSESLDHLIDVLIEE